MTQHGPQTREIEALLARVTTVTEDEAERLYDVRREVDAWYAARDALDDALGDASGDTRVDALDAVWDAFISVFRRRARGSVHGAWDAVLALLVRDLRDEDTAWNRAAYDLLTGPWRAVIGPVHPDDKEATT